MAAAAHVPPASDSICTAGDGSIVPSRPACPIALRQALAQLRRVVLQSRAIPVRSFDPLILRRQEVKRVAVAIRVVRIVSRVRGVPWRKRVVGRTLRENELVRRLIARTRVQTVDELCRLILAHTNLRQARARARHWNAQAILKLVPLVVGDFVGAHAVVLVDNAATAGGVRIG